MPLGLRRALLTMDMPYKRLVRTGAGTIARSGNQVVLDLEGVTLVDADLLFVLRQERDGTSSARSKWRSALRRDANLGQSRQSVVEDIYAAPV
jgi:hypothetical protein